MSGVFVVLLAAAGTWLVLHSIKEFHGFRRRHRLRHSFLGQHAAERRGRQLDREIRESHSIRWRR